MATGTRRFWSVRARRTYPLDKMFLYLQIMKAESIPKVAWPKSLVLEPTGGRKGGFQTSMTFTGVDEEGNIEAFEGLGQIIAEVYYQAFDGKENCTIAIV